MLHKRTIVDSGSEDEAIDSAESADDVPEPHPVDIVSAPLTSNIEVIESLLTTQVLWELRYVISVGAEWDVRWWWLTVGK
jgi:hypothetical protein